MKDLYKLDINNFENTKQQNGKRKGATKSK